MKTSLLIFACLLLFLGGIVVQTTAGPYLEDVDDSLDDYNNENNLERLLPNSDKRSSLIYLYRRACVRRGGNCDHRPKDCCYNSSCRCNLWGANCRCQRMGLFQKWGK